MFEECFKQNILLALLQCLYIQTDGTVYAIPYPLMMQQTPFCL